MHPFLRRAGAVLALLLLAAPFVARAECPPSPPRIDTERLKELRSKARDRGPLWRVTKEGRTSWLYGTMHVGREEWLVPGPQVLQAIMRSDTLAVEIDLTDQAALRSALSKAATPAVPPTIDPAVQKRLEEELDKACAPKQVRDMPIALRIMALTMMEARREGLFGEFGIDPLMIGMAKGMGKKVVGLETPADQLALISRNPDSARDTERIARSLEKWDPSASRVMLKRMAEMWERGDADRLLRFSEWCDKCEDSPEHRELIKALSDDRNGPMADKLAALHAEGHAFFAAVGMLHMPGPQGLAELLRQRGFTVEKIRFAEDKP